MSWQTYVAMLAANETRLRNISLDYTREILARLESLRELERQSGKITDNQPDELARSWDLLIGLTRGVGWERIISVPALTRPRANPGDYPSPSQLAETLRLVRNIFERACDTVSPSQEHPSEADRKELKKEDPDE